MQGIKYHLIDESPLNGRAFVTNSAGLKRTSAEADLEDSSDGESDGADSAKGAHVQLAMPIPDGPKPGKVKKTKGRVKIKMEFIDNKLRRYTTFSKRKTGIMKKAYELSTLTGTQVMLLVASETGHVYTFATRKLQPMITSDSGKALIQTCLNSPDPPPTTPSQQKAVDQRMNPTGFEETELSYAVNEEDGLIRPDSPDLVMPKNYPYQVQQQTPPSVHQTHSNTPSPLRQPPVTIEPQPQPAHQQPPSNNQQFTFMTPHSASQSPAPVSASVAKANPNISMQLTGGGGITILPSGLAAGTPLTLSALGNQQGLGGASGQQQTLYRIPNGQGGQAVVALPNMSQVTSQQVTSSAKSDQVGTITLSSSQPNVTVVPATGGSASTPPGTVMYQTPQGVVYAAPSSALPEGYIFNLPQTPALQVASPDSSASQQQQFITIPVSLAAGAQVLQPLLTSAVDAGRQKKLNK